MARLRNVNINLAELRELTNSLRDTSILRNATEIATNNAANIVVIQAKQNHIFTSRSHTLENAIFTSVERNKLEIFVPVEGALGVPYAPWIWYGRRPNPAGGSDIIWPDGPDPFIETAFETKKRQFINEFRSTLAEELEDHL